MAANDQAITLLQGASGAIQAAIAALMTTPAPAPGPVPPPIPVQDTPSSPPSPTAPAPAPIPIGLARVNRWIGTNKLGVYISPFQKTNIAGKAVRSADWRATQFGAVARTLRLWGVDFMAVKFGEYGNEWYDGTAPAIRQALFNVGMGMTPYYFNRPQTWQKDAAICIKLANLCGGIILDCEEQFKGQATALHNLVQTVRNGAPNACIIVTGYGAPVTAFGAGGWPFSAIKMADAYQPQTYMSVWSVYKRSGARAAIDWGMGQVAAEFQRGGLGLDFCIQPCIDAGINLDDLHLAAAYTKKWKASLMIWEAQGLTQQKTAMLKAGLA